MYPIKEHSITQTYKSFHAITLKDAWENAFFVLMDKLLRCAMRHYFANVAFIVCAVALPFYPEFGACLGVASGNKGMEPKRIAFC